MPDYTGGYTAALNDIARRRSLDTSSEVNQEKLREMISSFAEAQAERQRQMKAKQALGDMLPELADMFGFGKDQPQPVGPQPPPPGTPSTPMLTPPPAGGAPGPAPGAAPAGLPPGALPPPVGGQFMTTPPPASPTPPPAAAPAAPMPQGAGPGAPPPGAAMPPPPAAGMPARTGAPAPVGPVPWKALPAPLSGAPGGPGLAPPPSPQDAGAAMTARQVNVADLAKLLAKRGIKGVEAMDMLEQWKPFMDSENKRQLDVMKAEMTAQRAAAEVYRTQLNAAMRELDRKERERHDAVMEGQGQRRIEQADKRIAQGQQKINVTIGGAGTGGLTDDAKELAARQYMQTGQMPALYRDYKSRTEIMNRAAELAKQEGTLASVPGKRAEFKATTAALTQNTKDLSAIGPYNDMLETNGNIAIDLAKKAIATDSKLANRSINWLRQNMGDNPDTAEFLAQAQIVTTEAARVLNNPRLVGQLTDTARQEMEGIINGSMPLNSFERVVRRMQQDGRNRVAAMERKNAELVQKLSGDGGKPAAKKYVETRRTADGRLLGKTADGKIEEIKQ